MIRRDYFRWTFATTPLTLSPDSDQNDDATTTGDTQPGPVTAPAE